MAIMTHAKFHFNWLMLTLIFGIWASEPPRAWRTTEKAGPDRVNTTQYKLHCIHCSGVCHWSSLTLEIRDYNSFSNFRKNIKIYFLNILRPIHMIRF